MNVEIDNETEKRLKIMRLYLQKRFPLLKWDLESAIRGTVHILHDILKDTNEIYIECIKQAEEDSVSCNKPHYPK